jgi:hypothetical protein
MPYTDTQQVCLNGHQITDSINRNPHRSKKFCPSCGAETITNCPECNTPIPGHTYYENVAVLSGHGTNVPSHCHGCGNAFPWTLKEQKEISLVEHPQEFHPIAFVEKICSRFHLVARQLRDRHDDRHTIDIQDEYDVQDLLHSLLKIFFDDIRPEEYTPSYAGKSSRMDFLLKGYDTVVEVKMTRKGLGAKEVGSQLIDDIVRYQKHQECKTLICFVYDPEGRCANPTGIENDLSGNKDDLEVKVIIIPKGY